MEEQPLILVVGSINMDLAIRCPRLPEPGQTVLGRETKVSPGGKGANQAVAIARLGGRCELLGHVGQDAFGQAMIEHLRSEGVGCHAVNRTAEAPTGLAIVMVDPSGENAILVGSGANEHVSPDDVFAQADLFAQARVVLLQLELPIPTVRAAIDLGRRCGCKVILDPAPAPQTMPDALFDVDIITPNVSEAEAITSMKIVEDRVDKMAALDLLARGAKAAVLKLGPRGSMVVVSDAHFYRVGPYRVPVVDTTAAGDAFTGALALAVARGQSLHDAARFANAAGALACTTIGAQLAMPTAAAVSDLMHEQQP